jgi:hypothetical protein
MVVEFKLHGADGVVRAYTDCGFVGRDKQGQMPSAVLTHSFDRTSGRVRRSPCLEHRVSGEHASLG